jgi:hypothetical protein
MHDFFIHREHLEGDGFIAPRKPKCPDSYRVRDNDRRITPQAQFSGPQVRPGCFQDHRLQLKFHADMCIKRHLLENPNYFLVGFTSGCAFVYPQNLISFESFINFHSLSQYVGKFFLFFR